MENDSEQHIKIQIAISLQRMLGIDNRVNPDKESMAKSYGKIALHADLRKATVSDTFNAKSVPSSTTLFSIIKAMGFSLEDFAKIYESVKDKDIADFRI